MKDKNYAIGTDINNNEHVFYTNIYNTLYIPNNIKLVRIKFFNYEYLVQLTILNTTIKSVTLPNNVGLVNLSHNINIDNLTNLGSTTIFFHKPYLDNIW